MSEDKRLKHGAQTLFTDEQAAALNMAVEVMGLKHSTLLRQYAVRGLIQDQFLAHPAAKFQQAKKAG